MSSSEVGPLWAVVVTAAYCARKTPTGQTSRTVPFVVGVVLASWELVLPGSVLHIMLFSPSTTSPHAKAREDPMMPAAHLPSFPFWRIRVVTSLCRFACASHELHPLPAFAWFGSSHALTTPTCSWLFTHGHATLRSLELVC